jgi:cytidine deaminase
MRFADTASDRQLISAARIAIELAYDAEREVHTVGAAVRTKDGTIYVGVNVYSLHGACAEFVAIGAAAAAGERDIAAIACVRGMNGEELLAPCGNCRQMLSDLAPRCDVIIAGPSGEPIAVTASELLPFAYRVE